SLLARPGEPARLALLDGGDHLVLLRGSELREWLAVGPAAMLLERREPAPIEILQVRIGAGEREIDVVEHVGVARARLARRARHQPLGEGRHGRGVVLIEEGAKPFAIGMLVRGRRWRGGLFLL